MSKDTCYACGRPATSVEHVPPKCIFPEFKDANVDFRKNLITVPSCSLHNTEKSEDDEFLLFALVIHFKNNKAANDHFFSKVMRAVNRAPAKFRRMIQNFLPVDGPPDAAAAVEFDRSRIDHEIEMIARALYFHHTGEVLTEELRVDSPAFYIQDYRGLSQELLPYTVAIGAGLFIGPKTPFQGQNQDIFKYRFRHEPAEGIFVIEMLFYENFHVVVRTATSELAESGTSHSGAKL